MSDIFEKLKAPFAPDRISWRVGSTTGDKKKGLAFGYIDARDVMERLDEVCGPENWQCSYPHATGKTICSIGIRIVREDGSAEWIYKADGAGDSDVEAEKGAMSDAFKRSAVRFGIGRYLYDIPATWVLIEPMGKSFKIVEAEYSKLEAILRKGVAPATPVKTAKPEAPKKAVLSEDFTARIDYMVDCRDAIAAFTDVTELGNWWNSDEQKDARRNHQLDATQVAALKQAVMNRRDALLEKEPA
jgi:hypothetical protein